MSCNGSRLPAFAALLFSMLPGAAAADSVSYRGTIGNLPVAACLDLAEGSGEYYYLKYGKGIPLRQSEAGGTLLEENRVDPDGAPSGSWRVQADGQGRVRGSWWSAPEEAKQRQLPIALTPLGAGCDRFERLRLAPERPLTAADTPRFAHFYRTGLAEVIGFRLREGAPDAVRRKINRQLDEFFRAEAQQAFTCRDFSGAASVELYPDLLILDYHFESYCGGWAMVDHWTVRAYDLRTGQELTEGWDTLFKEEIDDERLSERVLADVMETEPAGAEPDLCRNRLDIGTRWLSGKGVNFMLFNMTRSHRYCHQTVLLPFAELRPFVTPERLNEFDSWVARLAGKSALTAAPARK